MIYNRNGGYSLLMKMNKSVVLPRNYTYSEVIHPLGKKLGQNKYTQPHRLQIK